MGANTAFSTKRPLSYTFLYISNTLIYNLFIHIYSFRMNFRATHVIQTEKHNYIYTTFWIKEETFT